MKLREYKDNNKIFVIADIAQSHDGSFGILSSLVKAVANTGVDAIKFQVHIPDAESSIYEPFRIPFSFVDATRFDYWKRMELSHSQWAHIKDICDSLNVEFIATPFSNKAVDVLESLNVHRYKIGSGDFSNLLLIEKIRQTGKELILSNGFVDISEAIERINILRSSGMEISLLQCTSEYPTSAQKTHLADLKYLIDNFDYPIGISDHSGTIFPSLASAALGATIIEAHVTFDKRMFGPDSMSSLSVDDFQDLVKGVRFISESRVSKKKPSDIQELDRMKEIFGRSLAVNADLNAGDIITFNCLEAKKPYGKGIPSADYELLLGRKLTKKKKKWDFLTADDFI
jgi:N,N'-diacetyllegionaminate synthase